MTRLYIQYTENWRCDWTTVYNTYQSVQDQEIRDAPCIAGREIDQDLQWWVMLWFVQCAGFIFALTALDYFIRRQIFWGKRWHCSIVIREFKAGEAAVLLNWGGGAKKKSKSLGLSNIEFLIIQNIQIITTSRTILPTKSVNLIHGNLLFFI